MFSQTTMGIKISVSPLFQPAYSNPEEGKFVFSYTILIENLGSETVQLLRRHWIISDANNVKREVEGEGVIGKQPILAPGEQHQYSSWCPISTALGKMSGSYLMQKVDSGEKFQAVVPEFQLIAPFKLN